VHSGNIPMQTGDDEYGLQFKDAAFNKQKITNSP